MTHEIRSQIRSRAKQFWIANDGPAEDPDGLFEDAYIEGAERQDPIAEKRDYNQGFQDALKKAARAITENHQKCITIRECEILNLKPNDE